MTERLLENVVDEVLEKDAIDDFNNSKGQPKGVGLTNLVKGINECGIPFKAWYKKNADGSTSKILEYTSLVGAQKKKLLNTLPAKFHEYLNPDTCATVHKIWISFNDYSNLITDFKLSRDAGGEVFEEGKAWIELFCTLRHARPGYRKARVTPYMHVMAYHVPTFVEKYGCFKTFTGQGVEKNNDDAKRMLFHKSNKWDAAKDILCIESRQWELKECERKKGVYPKRKCEYWDGGISKLRREKRLLSEASTSQVDDEDMSGEAIPEDHIDYSKCTVKELMATAKEKGLNKKGLSKLKNELIALLENH